MTTEGREDALLERVKTGRRVLDSLIESCAEREQESASAGHPRGKMKNVRCPGQVPAPSIV